MEILHKFKRNGYFTADLYHLLAKKQLVDVPEEILPSEYEKEMRMSTQERLHNLNSIMIDNIITADNKKPQRAVLSFTPKILVFQNYKQNEPVHTKFSVKNISEAPTYLNMVYKESSYFFIKHCSSLPPLSRLAPGISVTFSITFKPASYEDLTHRVTFFTDVAQYVVPIIAMGPRPVFNFPDEIVISKIPLKVENFVFVTVHNVGTVPAGFTMNTRSPFSVQPKSAYLNPGEKIDMKVGFKTMYLGTTDGIINAMFETGETFRVRVSGSTNIVTVELEKYIVRFNDTFKTMVRQQTLKITNKSNNILTFLCLKNENVYQDFEEKVQLATMFFQLKDSEAAKNRKLVEHDVVSSDEHERVYTRIFHDEIHSLVCDKTLQFQNMHFSITPAVGKLWPNKATDITITFSPKELGEFTATAYLDVDGVKQRIPLKMMGTSLPPAINLNVETLDMDCVYISKTYNYEIVAINKGHINGVVVFKEVPTLFGSHITCMPEMLCLRPGDKECFVISFCNSNQGPYFEEINFIIRDTNVVLKVYLKGTVIYPSLAFSVPCLDFGNVSLGVPKALELEVINESVVDVGGSLQISSDGPEISSVSLADYAVADLPKPQVPQWPREFDIQPCKFDIPPESRFSLKVILNANLTRANQTSLELELEKSDSPPIILPVLYNAMVPKITPAPDIKLRACFLDFTYTTEIQISSNDFWGYFVVEDTPNKEVSPVVEVSIKQGTIKPNSTITLPVAITMKVLGPQEHTVRVNLFGLSKTIDICHISGSGVRPIVTCTPTALHWGQVKLLNKFQKSLTLFNDSPVFVYFKASLFNKDGKWQIFPAEGFIAPESETDIILHLYLVDADTYTNKAVIQLEKVKDILVPLSATGVGTSIVVGELRDRIMLGRHFTKIPLNCKVVIQNYGTRIHSLEWSEHYKAPKTKLQPPTAFFNLDLKVFKIAAGEKIELTIIGLSYKVTTIKETWYLVGSVEGINKKELLLECPIVAEFVDPKIEVSSSIIELQYDYGPYSEYYKLTDIVSIKNVSKLPLDLDINLKPPFAIIQKHSTYKILPEEENLCCCICYRECDLNIINIINEVGLHQSKTFIDFLTLKPVEPLRQGPLKFFQDINKIKMAFSLTHSVQERLEDQEVMKLQILFDTTKHVTLKSRVYTDLMKIKFQGHKNKDAVKLIGTTNFPNLFVLSPRVDFQCILNASIESKTIKIQNVTPLLVCYKFQWKKCSLSHLVLPEPPKIEIMQKESSKMTGSETGTGFSEPIGNIEEMLLCPAPSEAATPNELEEGPSQKECVMTTNETTGAESTSMAVSEFDSDFMKLKVIKKVAPMLHTNYEPPFDWIWKLPKIAKPTKLDINEVMQLTPHRGLLKPGEIQYVHVIFRPKANINVKAILECEVLGGPSEMITVTGQSSELMYGLNSKKVNFKIRSFHESASEEIIITNIATLPFKYNTYLNEPKFENELEGTILDLVPSEKILDQEETATLKIVMRPGVVGYFNRVFLLEIGHLPYIPIEVFGWGVIPQVYLTLPRPDIINLNNEFGFRAIPTLTAEYLEAVNEIFTRAFEDSEHINSVMTEKCFDDITFQHDWHICSSWDNYPSIMDIELAIERMLVINHIKMRPEILTAYSANAITTPIQGFLTTPYVIDYGVVITGSTVQCLAEIINYNPIATKLHFAKGTRVPNWINIKLCGKLMPGETGKLDVVFSPTSNDFKNLEETANWSFNLEVPCGVTIPVKVKALCAVPYLSSNVSEINFGLVRCGDKIVCSIPLKNVGKPTCIWYVTLKLKAPGLNPMTIMDTSGKYEPGEEGWLSVAFKPTMEMTYEGMLIFRFHMNPNRMTIPISGQGIIPHVHVIGPNINFPPTLPWAETTDSYFGLTNPCPFPIELIIAHSDENCIIGCSRKWKEEEEVFQLLYKYYNKPDEMLVPVMKPGAEMPAEIMGFVKELSGRVKKTKDEEAAAASKALTARGTTIQKGKGKSPKNASKGTTSKEVPTRKFRGEAEIMSDEIKKMKEEGVDPLKECLHVFNKAASKSDSAHLKGVVVFFHATPGEEMQSLEMSYTLGMNLGIPTMTFDYCIVQALCVSECPAQALMVSAINDSYDTARRNAKDDNFDDEQTEEMFDNTEDDFDTMLKKINYIATVKNVGTPRSKASEKKKPTNSSAASHSVLGTLGSPTMFQTELVQELLSDYFKRPQFSRGFVIDSLTSMMVKIPHLVLTTVLKCTLIRNIHLVLCQSDFAKWAQIYDETQRESEMVDENAPRVYNAEEIEEIIQMFENMDDEEYENASPELKAIYITNGLEQRRKKYIEKYGVRQEVVKKDKNINKTEYSKSVSVIEGLDQKKKVKKDETRKPTNEYLIMNSKYNEYYKTTYDNLINIANNWLFDECEIGMPIYGLNGQIVGGAQKKSKKRSEMQLAVSEVNVGERGFPLTLIMAPCLRYKCGLVQMFEDTPFIQEALREEEEHNVLNCPIERREYTVLLPKTFPTINHEAPLNWRYLDEMPIKKCECNQLTDLYLLDDSTQDYVIDILSKWHCVCGKKVTSSQTSTSEIPSASVEKESSDKSKSDDVFYPEPLRKVHSMQSPSGSGARLILQPGDLLRCKYSFSPELEGNFSVKRFVEVAGWPDSRIDINVTGTCDIPRLDSRPKKMFANFVRRTVEDNVYKLAFLDDVKIFEFGPIFTGALRVYEEEYSIDLKNSSLITTEVVIEFLVATTIFEIDKTSITLEPGCRVKLTITAAPLEVGVHRSVLLFCVKDNPEMVTVTVGCSGVHSNVEILPISKHIDYGKLLLYRKEDDRFIVKNDSILPIMWKLPNAEEFLEDFIIAKTSGIIQRNDNQVVPVTYIACNVGVITAKMLTIHIYDSLGRGNPLLVDNIYFSAECYDVMVECAYEIPTENFLNYGYVKVNSNVVREMYLLNKGKYNIYYKMKKVKNFPEPALLKSFEAYPDYGIVPPTMKMVTIEFDCTPITSMNLVNVPAYTCSLLDGSRDQVVVVAKFPVCVTIASFYNTFTLFPFGELNFHIIAIGSGVTREVILNNTSKCPVTYEIVLPSKYLEESDASPALKIKDNKIKTPALRCGNFYIMNEDNLLAPGTSRVIQIQFLASAARKFEETIHFVISDTCPAEANGVPLKLVGTGAVPILDFWNIETTFREHLIVKSLSEYKIPESSPHCVFVENSVTLHFFCVNVNSSYTGAIHLYNNGLVACALKMVLHYQSNSDSSIFSLDKYDTHIEPLLHKKLDIIFTPKELQEYRAVLEIKLKLLDNKTQSFKLCLIGEGVIPRIQLINPKVNQNRVAYLKFPVTCLGSVSSKQIKFTNITSVKSIVKLYLQHTREERPVFWLTTSESCEHMICDGRNDLENKKIKVIVKPNEIATIIVHYNPINKGKISCDVTLKLFENPFEYFTVICEAEAFMEDVILVGLEMLSMDLDLDTYKAAGEVDDDGAPSTIDSEKKSKNMAVEKRRSKSTAQKKRMSVSTRNSESQNIENSELKYVLNFGGCELCVIQRRSVVMINNSEKVYKFEWVDVEHIVTKPSIGYISPGEEKDIELIFFAGQPVNLVKECLICNLMGVGDDFLTLDWKGTTWDNRQIVTLFDHNREASMNERCELVIDDQNIAPPPESLLRTITMLVIYSAITEYSKYKCTLKEESNLLNTFIYQTRTFEFKVENVGKVPLKISWSFHIDDEYPMRIDKHQTKQKSQVVEDSSNNTDAAKGETGELVCIDQQEGISEDPSKITLFSGSTERQSVDTWFEIDLPFKIEPDKACLAIKESCSFKVIFSPLEAFDFKVKLKSCIENLDPYDQNITCKISAKSLVPYVHLDIEESDYLTANRRKVVGLALPVNMTVLEFNVLGWGCYKRSFNVINPTNNAYEFIFEMVMPDTPKSHMHLIPVHCDMLKGYAEGGTSTEVTFTFSPTAPGVYESQWKFIIPIYDLVIDLLVVGIVREPEVVFVPTILLIRNTLVGFTTTNVIILKNNENQALSFEFKGNSLCNESGKRPVIVDPEQGVLKPRSETPIQIIYTPIQDGPLSFKIFCSVMFMTKYLTLCVNALSFLIKPKVTYYLTGNEHVLNSEAITNIYLDQTASTYERTIPFIIKNDGSATFFFDWHYMTSGVKKYLQFYVEPKNGHIAPGNEVECTAYFTLRKVLVRAFPVTLSISDGPEYSVYLYADIKKPLYHFSCTHYDFGKCFVNAPDTTYKKNIAFICDNKEPIILHLNFKNIPELLVDYHEEPTILPGDRLKVAIYFRPKQVREYEFKLQFWVNSLYEEVITIKGEGIPLLFDLYEGCQKSFNLGHVKVGEKIVRTIEVMNHSKIPIEAFFKFRDMYPIIKDTTLSDVTSVCLSQDMNKGDDEEPSRGKNLQVYKNDKIRTQIAKDTENALSSLKVVPNKCIIYPYRKVSLKIQFKPIGMIRDLDIQLNMKVLHFERPLVKLSGCATGMSFCLNQNSLQFGRVRKRGRKILKVMLSNNGDFGARFWWQPLISDEFKISPQYGNIAAHTNVTFTITFRPMNYNPFIKVWASCNIENYMPLELAMYATCVDLGNVQNQTLYLECPVREVVVENITVTNPTDELWQITSEISQGPGGSFETPSEFNIEPNSTFDIPMKFKPKIFGKHQAQVLYSPLGEHALFVYLVGIAGHPNPNGTIRVSVPAKDSHTEELFVRNITATPETYLVSTEIQAVIPDKFDGFYDIKHPDKVKVWGGASATCRWTFICYEECEMHFKVMFVDEVTREYQFYNIIATITPCQFVGTVVFVSRARESVQKEVVFANSLQVEADYVIECASLTCPDKVLVGPSSETLISMTYSPLVVGETEDRLEVYNNLAGSIVYRIKMKCLPAKIKEIDVATPLGTSVPLRLRVQNNTNIGTDFVTTITHSSIQSDQLHSLGPFEKGKFLANFEPTDLGIQNCTVSFNSANAGEFVFSIKGKGLPPKPQGPFDIKAGGYTSIKFKNVFDEARTFRLFVDREEFYVKTALESIKSKKELRVTVYLSDVSKGGTLPSGCLTIECYDPPVPKALWTYFLRGVS